MQWNGTKAFFGVVYATQRKRVVSKVLLNRPIVQNLKGIRLKHKGAELAAKVLFLNIYRGKPYLTTVKGLQNFQFCNQLSANEQVRFSKGLTHINSAKAKPREPRTT